MALSRAIQRATRQNRRRQTIAERRMDEQLLLEVARAQLTEEWSAMDVLGDDRFQRVARDLYATLTTEQQRDALTKLYAEWSRDEAQEERILTNARATNLRTIVTFRRNTPVFVEGAVIADEDGRA
jgi:hypothetical protein